MNENLQKYLCMSMYVGICIYVEVGAFLRQLRPGLPESEDSSTFRAFRGGEVSKQSESDAAPLDTPRAQKVRTVLRFRAPRGGEVSNQSEWEAAPLDTPGAQKVRTILRFRAPRGGDVSKQSERDATQLRWTPQGLRK